MPTAVADHHWKKIKCIVANIINMLVVVIDMLAQHHLLWGRLALG